MRQFFLMFSMILMVVFFVHRDSMAQQKSEKVYRMVTTEVSVGNLAAYHAFNANELTPLMEKHGYNLVAAWQTIVGNIEEVIFVAEFENMSAYHKSRKSLWASETWKSTGEKMDTFTKKVRTRFLSATPYSKLQ